MDTHRHLPADRRLRRLRTGLVLCLAIGLFAGPAVSVWAMSCHQAERSARHCQSTELAFEAPPCHQSAALVCCDQRTTPAECARSGPRSPIERNLVADLAALPSRGEDHGTTTAAPHGQQRTGPERPSGRALLAHKATLLL